MWQIRRAVVGDEALLRDLRLEALTDSPVAFGSTCDREIARTMDDWRRWMSPGATFILEAAGRPPRGLVAAAYDADSAGVVQLMAMWVHPDARGSGAAAALVAAVVDWARTEGARVVQLQVVESNLRARRSYERNGFALTGRTRIRERDGAIELQMERPIEWPIERPI